MDETQPLLKAEGEEKDIKFPNCESLGANLDPETEDIPLHIWTYDEAVEQVGFGIYQLVLWFFLSLIKLSSIFNNLTMVFEGGDSNHWCHTPDNFTTSDNTAITYYPGKCSYNISILNSDGTLNATQHNIKCSSWKFDRSVFNSTINSEWQLACDKEYLISLTTTSYWIGNLLGFIFLGSLADRFGRKTILLTSALLTVLVSVGAAFSPTLVLFTVLRFFVGVGVAGCRVSAYTLSMEYSRSRDRGILGVYNELVYSIGYVLMTLIFYLDPNWRRFQIYITIPSAIVLTYIFFIPESPRWQLTVGHSDAALQYFRRSAYVNKKILPDNLKIVLYKSSELLTNNTQADRCEPKKSSFLDLVRTSNMRKLSVACGLLWFFFTLAYFGISYNAGNLYGSIYMNMALIGGMDLVANLAAMCMIRIPRKLTIVGSFTVTAVAMLVASIVQDMNLVPTAMSMIGMLAITCCDTYVTVVTVELYPTQARALALGLGVGVGGISAAVAPFVQLSFQWWDRMPSVIFTATGIIGALAGLTIPETKDRTLPESIEAADEMNQVGFSFCKHGSGRSTNQVEATDQTEA